MATAAWKATTINPLKVALDPLNPRIEVEPNAQQGDIRLKLLELEDVVELAREIEKNSGLFYGERVITTSEGPFEVVLEGNRRVAACQMLLDRSLIPAAYRSRFPIASAATTAAIGKVLADVAPSRAAAEPILTKRHTERGAKPWSPVAKMRRAARLLEHYPPDKVAEILGTTTAAVNKLIRPYRLLKYALDLKIWSAPERKALENEKLKTNPYTRLFTLRDTKDALQITFDDDQNIASKLPAVTFKKQMGRIARDFLLPDPATGQATHDTRTDTRKYFAELLDKAAAGGPTKPNPGKPEPAKKEEVEKKGAPARPNTPKASVFFENLQCHVTDDRLINLTREIRNINHKDRPIAASLLLRALFECALVYKMQSTKTWATLVAAQKTAGYDPGLADMIKFCSNFQNGVFAEVNICKALKSHTTHTAKTYLDAITHYKYQEADSTTLESIANNLRQVIGYILAGH